jgi:hypothetical protein
VVILSILGKTIKAVPTGIKFNLIPQSPKVYQPESVYFSKTKPKKPLDVSKQQ